jgi:hypothetical protein
MKTLLISFLLVINGLMTFGQTYLSGEVKNITNGVPNHQVHIYCLDSVYPYQDTKTTNYNGVYIDTLLLPSGVQSLKFSIWTVDICTGDGIQAFFNVSNTSQITAPTLYVCSDPTVCKADFCWAQDTSTPNTIIFTNTSIDTNLNTSFFWYFYDGTTSNLQNPHHTYAPSSFPVYITNLTISSQYCTSTHWDTVYIIPQTHANIYGQVFADSNYLDHGYAILYNISGYNMDTAVIDSSGYYAFNYVQQGNYYVKAFPSPNSIYYGDHFPTYYPHDVSWVNATPIHTPSVLNPYDIDLVKIEACNAGPGNISGYVNHTSKSTVPAADMEVVLMDASGNATYFKKTDNNGYYEFSNLSFGLYKLVVDLPGLVSETATIILDANNSTVTNINFLVSSNSIVLSVEDFENKVSIFPNPVNSVVHIQIGDLKDVTIELVNNLGQVVYSKANVNNDIEIYTEKMTSGVYSLLLRNKDVVINKKLLVGF